MDNARIPRKLAAILAVDVVGYSRLASADEADTLARLKRIRRQLFAPALATHGGRLVKLMGDGALVEFASAVDALGFAIDFQTAVEAAEPDTPADRRIRFRVGIHVGDVIVEGSDLYGEGVNIAARLEALAEPGGIRLSRAVADQVQDRLAVRLEAHGDQALKNIKRPVEVFAVVEAAPAAETEVGPGAAAAPSKTSIAVLAFDNMSGEAEQEYFSDGIAEDIITDLSKIGGLHVIARNSSFVYKQRPVSVPELGRELGVRYVLEGSVRRASGRIRVNAQLIDAGTGGHIWADRYDRELTDIFTVQDELTREIVGALKLRLEPGERERLGRRREPPVAAYELYLRAREQVFLHTRTGNAEAMRLCRRAVEIDPSYAAARGQIAFLHVIDYVNGWGDDGEASLARGRSLADEAVAMDPDEPLAHFALSTACTWQGELERAIEAAKRCLKLAPSSIEGHLALARALIFIDRPTEALTLLESALQLDPLCPDIVLQFIAEAQMSLGDAAAADQTLRERLARNPEAPTAHALSAAALGHLGRHDEARRAWAETLRLEPGWSIERRRRLLPFRDPTQFERRLQGLQKAGIVS